MLSIRAVITFLVLTSAGCGRDRNIEPAALALPRGGNPEPATSSQSHRRVGRITSEGKIISDTFEIRHEWRGERLSVAIETDLPDNTTLMVGVHRTYRANDDSAEHVVEYFSEKSTVGAWRVPRALAISNDMWKRELEERRRMSAVAGEPFTVRSINDTVQIAFTVPFHQDPPFEPWNANLEGEAVEIRENVGKLISRDLPLVYPIDASDLDQTQWADPLNLSVGKTYEVSRVTPLMPEIEPADPMDAIARIQQLRVGTHVRVREVRQLHNSPWYRVNVVEGERVRAEGWINSTALLGQQIKEVGS